jgi:hypothetical protein
MTNRPSFGNVFVLNNRQWAKSRNSVTTGSMFLFLFFNITNHQNLVIGGFDGVTTCEDMTIYTQKTPASMWYPQFLRCCEFSRHLM